MLQFYPESPEQALLITTCASKCGFTGGLVVDYPNSSRAKKYYLCLSFERAYTVPKALGTEAGGVGAGNKQSVNVVGRISGSGLNAGGQSAIGGQQRGNRRVKASKATRVKAWIQEKKKTQRRQGKQNVASDSKFTGRKRSTPF